jgi:putative hydrolase of the HAD superfamily
MKYKAVIFDFYGTLVDNFPSTESNAVLKRVAAAVSVSPEDFVSRWLAAYNERMTGEAKNCQACIKNICRRLGAQPSEQQIELAASIKLEMTRREVMSCKEGALEALSYLKTKGYKTGLLSNASTETARLWPKTPLATFIDAPVFSSLEGIMKPDPRIFEIAVKKLKVLPQECVYIADGMSQELTAASKLGMNAILINVPHDSDYEHDREVWHGRAISSLKEIRNLL